MRITHRPFRLEVSKDKCTPFKFSSASYVFCLDFWVHFITYTENLGISCGYFFSSSPSTCNHWPDLVRFLLSLLWSLPSVSSPSFLHVQLIGPWPTISPLCNLAHTLWADWITLCSILNKPHSIWLLPYRSRPFGTLMLAIWSELPIQLPRGTKVMNITIVFWFSSKMALRLWLVLSRHGSSHNSNLHDAPDLSLLWEVTESQLPFSALI